MSEAYWQSKIWGLLRDPALKALYNSADCSGNSFWQQLAVMKDWQEHGLNSNSVGKFLQYIQLADYIASVSDRAAIASLDMRDRTQS